MSEASPDTLQALEPGRLREIANRLHEADAVTPELVSDIIHETCWRLPKLRRTRDFDRLQQLIQSGAWTDATLLLLNMELPQWQLRRVAYDAGEWHCALSRQRELPDWLDQPVEARHGDFSLAILAAFLDVKRSVALSNGVTGAVRVDEALDVQICCDNFA